MKTVKGTPRNILAPIVGRITKRQSLLVVDKDVILVSREVPKIAFGYSALITTAESTAGIPSVNLIDDLDCLCDGDVVQINVDGSIRILWEAESHQNAFFITDYCNSACIMCPQKANGESHSYNELNKKVLSLIRDADKVEHIGITGGEPTVCLDSIVDILRTCKSKFPKAAISLLTNGKLLADFEVAKRLADSNRNVMYCVPLYAPADVEHDLIVGSQGSFSQTLMGLYNLARLKCPVEIRIVIMKQNFGRLVDLAEFIYRNMPFVVHVAIMGMETSGVAKENLDNVWIEPKDYQHELRQCVLELHRRSMNISVYNLPYCLLPKELWRFARNSISGWKKAYLPVCENCDVKTDCAGTFATSVRQSSHIGPIVS